MTITLTKHEGLGNDFLIAIDPPRPFGPADARAWCDRRLGIGADGLISLDTSLATPRMVLHNADGSRAEISGNGIRCVAQALARCRGIEGAATFEVETDAGVRVLDLTPSSHDPDIVEVAVDMGAALDGPPDYGRWPDLGVAVERQVGLDFGNPHLVALVDDPDRYEMAAIGPAVEASYPDGLNVHLVAVDDRSTVRLRVWERGAGVTRACGSGASAAGTAAIRWGLADSPVRVNMPGGAVTVAISAEGAAVLTGPARFIASIEVPDRG